MGWLAEFAVQTVADLFGLAVGHKKPWWVELVAYFGCLIALGVPILVLWVLLR